MTEYKKSNVTAHCGNPQQTTLLPLAWDWNHKELLLPRKDSLSPAPSNDVRMYRITLVSWPCPLLATAKN